MWKENSGWLTQFRSSSPEYSAGPVPVHVRLSLTRLFDRGFVSQVRSPNIFRQMRLSSNGGIDDLFLLLSFSLSFSFSFFLEDHWTQTRFLLHPRWIFDFGAAWYFHRERRLFFFFSSEIAKEKFRWRFIINCFPFLDSQLFGLLLSNYFENFRNWWPHSTRFPSLRCCKI